MNLLIYSVEQIAECEIINEEQAGLGYMIIPRIIDNPTAYLAPLGSLVGMGISNTSVKTNPFYAPWLPVTLETTQANLNPTDLFLPVEDLRTPANL